MKKHIVTLMLAIALIATGVISGMITKKMEDKAVANESNYSAVFEKELTMSEVQDDKLVTCRYYYEDLVLMVEVTISEVDSGKIIKTWNGPMDELSTKSVETRHVVAFVD